MIESQLIWTAVAYNGHFGCTCYHPLFCFNQFGDCEGFMLRPGNVHSADRWNVNDHQDVRVFGHSPLG